MDILITWRIRAEQSRDKLCLVIRYRKTGDGRIRERRMRDGARLLSKIRFRRGTEIKTLFRFRRGTDI